MGFAELLTQRGRLEKGTVTNPAGAEEVSWALWSASVPVLVRQARPPADLRLGTDEAVTHVIYCLPIIELTADPGPWRFVVDARTYAVVDAHEPAHRRHHLEIRARRLV